eukprot:2677624-Amphidinium_carterae.1
MCKGIHVFSSVVKIKKRVILDALSSGVTSATSSPFKLELPPCHRCLKRLMRHCKQAEVELFVCDFAEVL